MAEAERTGNGQGRVVRILARLNTGGVAGPVLTQAIHGIDGYEQVIVAGHVESNEEEMASLLRRLDREPYYVDALRRSISPRADLAAYHRITDLLSELEPQIVETHTAKAGLLGRLAVRRYNRGRRARGEAPAAVVHYFHGHIFRGDYFGPAKTAFFLWLERRLARTATTLIAVPCRQQALELSGEFRVGRPEQYRVVPYGVELDLFERDHERHRAAFREELGLARDTVAVGMVGRLEPVKNPAMFLDSAARLVAFHDRNGGRPDVAFLLIGDGDLRVELEARAERLGLGDRVRFLGVRHDRERFFAGLDVVALTSTNEGYPNVLLEAMASSRPVVATAAGGVKDLVRDEENGLLVDVGDVDGLTAALDRIVRDSALRRRMADAGRAFVRSEHDVEAMVSGAKAVYDEMTQ